MNICKYTTLNSAEIYKILSNNKTCKLSTTDNININISPMWYTFDLIENTLIFYFIASSSSEKMSNMKYTTMASILVERITSSCNTEVYETILANGRGTIVTNYNEKKYIINKFKNKYPYNYFQCLMSDPNFIRISITEIIGKKFV